MSRRDDVTVPSPSRTRSALLFASLHGYDRRWLRSDLVAGLTVWAVLVPEALAYASIAGVSPVIGLYAAPPALILYAAFGSSKHLVTGPMSATAALTAAAAPEVAVGSDDVAALTATLALVTGVFAVLAGLLRLGFLAGLISEPVIKGFIIGLALTIIVGQLPKLLGIDKAGDDFFEQLWNVVAHLGDTSVVTLAVGTGCLAIVLAGRRVAPAVPGSLVVVALGVILVSLFDLDDHGLAIVGPIDSGLPSLGLPEEVDFDRYLALAGSAVGLMIVGFAEGLGAAKTYAARDHYEIDANRELLGLGTANLSAGLCQGMVVNGSLSKTAVNGSAGARTQLSGIVVAAMTVVTLLLLTGLFENLPEATLAAVVIAAVAELVDFRALLELYRLSSSRLREIYGVAARPDFIAAVAAMVGVLVFDTLPGLFIGIGVSLLLLLYRASHPHLAELGKVPGTNDQYGDRARHPDNETPPGILVLRVEGALFFANADTVRRSIEARAAAPGLRAVVLDGESISSIDVTAVHMLAELADQLETGGVRLVVAGDLGQVRDVLRREAAIEDLDHVYPTVQAAVDELADR
jgi:high affinity sulfate transporter 1